MTAAAGQIALTFDRLLPTYIAKVEPVDFGLNVDKGPNCSLFVTAAAAKSTSASGTLGCFVEWLSLPDGLAQDTESKKPRLKGILASATSNTVQWRVSAVLADGTVLPITEQAKEVPAAEPTQPVISLSGLDEVTTDNGDAVLVADGREYLTIRVEASNLPHAVKVTRNGQLLEQRSYGKSGTSSTTRETFSITHEAAQTWAETEYQIEVTYSALGENAECVEGGGEDWACPAKLTQIAVQVPSASIEAVVDVPEREGLSNAPIEVTAGIQNRRADGDYDPETWGEWQIRVVKWIDRETYEPLTEFKALGSDTETFSVDPESAAGDYLRIAAEMVLESELEGYKRTEVSRTDSIRIYYAGVIEASLSARDEAGEAPFLARLTADLTNRDYRYSLGSINWERSSDGRAWAPLETSRSYSTRFQLYGQRGRDLDPRHYHEQIQ